MTEFWKRHQISEGNYGILCSTNYSFLIERSSKLQKFILVIYFSSEEVPTQIIYDKVPTNQTIYYVPDTLAEQGTADRGRLIGNTCEDVRFQSIFNESLWCSDLEKLVNNWGEGTALSATSKNTWRDVGPVHTFWKNSGAGIVSELLKMSKSSASSTPFLVQCTTSSG